MCGLCGVLELTKRIIKIQCNGTRPESPYRFNLTEVMSGLAAIICQTIVKAAV